MQRGANTGLGSLRLSSLGLALLLGLQACSAIDGRKTSDRCDSLFYDLESLAAKQTFVVSEPRAVPAYPALGTNRFLASFDPANLSAEAREDWLQRLIAAGQRRRALLLDQMALDAEETDKLSVCSESFAREFSRDDAAWTALSDAVAVPDDYSGTQRAFGLYPLTSLGVRSGVKTLQRQIMETFALPLEELPVQGRLQRYVPDTPSFEGSSLPRDESPGVASATIPLPKDRLGVMVQGASPADVAALFLRHAPMLEVDTQGDFDRPGEPFFAAGGMPSVQATRPVAYRYLSLTHFAGAPRIQLNYVFWFSERPPSGSWDSLAGRLDGLHWRVTLDDVGQVLLYDSIHACGCYQQFFPSTRLALREEAKEFAEPPLVPQAAPPLLKDERIVLRLASGTHYLQRVYGASLSGQFISYAQEPYTNLYRIDGPEGKVSLFADEGLVPGTARGERWYLWPMGVRSPGAMRERGRHATAFLGRRHFDDAYLLDSLFRLAPQS